MTTIRSFTKIHPLWIICILMRLVISCLPLIYDYFKKTKSINEKLLENIITFNKIIIYIIGIGFLYKSLFGSNNETQVKKVFWHRTRIIHSIFYLLAAVNYHNLRLSSSILFIDVSFSIFYRYMIGHFKYN